jgi:hypothetical protein
LRTAITRLEHQQLDVLRRALGLAPAAEMTIAVV